MSVESQASTYWAVAEMAKSKARAQIFMVVE
jgi:hypothetical protein